MTPRRANGFTLVEVLIALMLASIIAASGRALLYALANSGDRVASSAGRDSRTIDALRLLREVVFAARPAAGDSLSFLATTQGAHFRSWCPTPGGWREPCAVVLSVADSGRSVAMDLLGETRSRILLAAGVEAASLAYLRSAANGGTWLKSWSYFDEMPVAIGVIVDRDTSIVPLRVPDGR